MNNLNLIIHYLGDLPEVNKEIAWLEEQVLRVDEETDNYQGYSRSLEVVKRNKEIILSTLAALYSIDSAIRKAKEILELVMLPMLSTREKTYYFKEKQALEIILETLERET